MVGSLVDCTRQEQSESSLINHVLDLRQPVRLCSQIPFQELSLSIHVYVLLLFYFRSVPVLRTNLFVCRCLRARINVCLSTRSVEDRGLLELPTG